MTIYVLLDVDQNWADMVDVYLPETLSGRMESASRSVGRVEFGNRACKQPLGL